ncbi:MULTISPECIES: carboxysome shell carbonic anhydrase [unclassified Prochlorococcus]|uniref:carboxysome shell carbonic anhydrase n=1 Tax=unclassified Prochlorococcus TaxID=2627481 RepID=UPI000533BCC6|nr:MULTISPECIES: carboxysome shell carbonic anhydrase [unclassified Prochlorococcus]KGG16406.1 carboxysome shell protein CsoS3 [Prochlorococcus sp. MIT 0602]KGG17119.1 carboxysome shell protein CsoS3 [Prochlorococcus sp. MIT 0603]
MAYKKLARNKDRILGPTAPRKSYLSAQSSQSFAQVRGASPLLNESHPLTDLSSNKKLQQYEEEVKGKFDQIVPLLKKISTIQHEDNFIDSAQKLAKSQLGFELPEEILEKAWVRPLDMRALFATCVFQAHQLSSNQFFNSDPLGGSEGSHDANLFESFLSKCGFHLLDVTPCADGRLAHSISYALRIPFSAVRRRSHAGALFDVENTVNRWVKTEHRRYRESLPNSPHEPTRYLKVVVYHFSSINPSTQGCAAHGSDDSLAASEGLQRLLDFKKSVENSFCCGASVELLLIGLDTDTDAIRVHVPNSEGQILLDEWVSAIDIYEETKLLSREEAIRKINEKVNSSVPGNIEKGMVDFVVKLIVNNLSQIDYVRQLHNGPYPDEGHAERFIGVGIGFKEVHLRNLTYFAHLDTVEEGAPDLDVGIKIFKGLNVSRDLPIPVVIRFDYSGQVPGARERAILDCKRVDSAISFRYRKLVDDGLLHTCLTIRDRNTKSPAEVVGSSLDPVLQEEH